MKTKFSDIPVEIIGYIAYFLNPTAVLTLNQHIYNNLYTNDQYWKEITIRDFEWVLKCKPTSSEEKSYMQLYKILFCYYRPLKNKKDKIPLSPMRQLPQLQNITPSLDAKFIPQWLNEQMFLESLILHKSLAIDLCQIAIQYNHLFTKAKDLPTQIAYQKKIIQFGEKALAAGFEEKYKTCKMMLIGILSNAYSGEQLFNFLEKHYQYRSIYFKASQFDIDLEHVHQQWWDRMLVTLNPQAKRQQISGLLELYSHYEVYNTSLPGLSTEQLTDRIIMLRQIADSMKTEKPCDSKVSAIFTTPSERPRAPVYKPAKPSSTSCLIS